MKKLFTLLFSIIGCLAICQPNNDNCNSAATLNSFSGNGCVGGSFTTVAATPSTQTAAFAGANDDDVWFTFTTPNSGSAGSVKVNVKLCNIDFGATTPAQFYVELRTPTPGICDNSLTNTLNGTIASSGGEWALTTLNPNTQYSIRIYTAGTTARATFDLCCYIPPSFAAPTNDDCANAQNIVVTTGTGTYNQPEVRGATPSCQASGDGTGKDDDVWFTFTTNATNNNATVSLTNLVFEGGGFAQMVIELWNTCGNASYANWYPFSSTASLGALLPNTNYKVRVYSYGSSTRLQNFTIGITLAAAPPANDTYFNAQTITFSSNTTCAIAANGTTVGATTEFPPSCTGATTSPPNDVWYKFVATNTQLNLQLTNIVNVAGTNNTMWMQVFESSNSSPSKACSNTGTLNFDGSTTALSLTIGTTYYIRVYNNDAANTCTFSLCGKLPNGQVYNLCSRAVNLVSSGSDGLCSQKVTLSNLNAVPTNLALPPGTTGASACNNEIWVKFTTATSGIMLLDINNFVRASANHFSNANFYVAIYSGSCGSPTFVNLQSGLSTFELTGLNASTVYYARIFTLMPQSQGSFDVCLRSKPAPQASQNNTCATAITITASTNNNVTFTEGNTQNFSFTSNTNCDGVTVSQNLTAWYKFVATATSHVLEIKDVVALGMANTIGARIYSSVGGACSPLTPVGNCMYTQGTQTLTSLTVGVTYFVELMVRSGVNYPTASDVSFRIGVRGAVAPNNDEGAQAEIVLQQPFCQSTSAGSFNYATLSAVPTNPAPSAKGKRDVWYLFIAAHSSGSIIINSPIIFASPYVALYTNLSMGAVPVAQAYGSTFNFSGLTAGTPYYARITDTLSATSVSSNNNFTFCISGLPSLTPATNIAACTAADATQNSTAANRWLHFSRGGNMIVSMYDGPATAGANFTPRGVVTARYVTNSGAIRTNAGNPYLDRNFELDAGANNTLVNSPVRVRFYFTRAEVDALINASNSNVNFINDFRVIRLPGQACATTLNTAGAFNYALAGFGSFGTDGYYIDMITPNFSGFFFSYIADNLLPSSCTNFNYKLNGNNVQLVWTNTNEVNNNYIEVERSEDGINYTRIAKLNAVASGNYAFAEAVNGKNYYYRLKQTNKDGTKQFICRTLRVEVKTKPQVFGSLYPNPVKNQAFLDIVDAYTGKVTIEIINNLGQVISQENKFINSNDVRLTVNTQQLAAGNYTLKLTTIKQVQTIGLVKW